MVAFVGLKVDRADCGGGSILVGESEVSIAGGAPLAIRGTVAGFIVW